MTKNEGPSYTSATRLISRGLELEMTNEFASQLWRDLDGLNLKLGSAMPESLLDVWKALSVLRSQWVRP